MPGCVTEGKNLEDAFENATDAASGWVLDELEEGNVVPKSSDYDSVERREGGQVSMVLLDMDAYAERYIKANNVQIKRLLMSLANSILNRVRMNGCIKNNCVKNANGKL